mmetsp:Transcript_18093/g.31224  ORF Transcript_18093/g.31224 Transcript_18093/m.31224 type:complete len:302 (+) Transcript_18093:30-935(+)
MSAPETQRSPSPDLSEEELDASSEYQSISSALEPLGNDQPVLLLQSSSSRENWEMQVPEDVQQTQASTGNTDISGQYLSADSSIVNDSDNRTSSPRRFSDSHLHAQAQVTEDERKRRHAKRLARKQKRVALQKLQEQDSLLARKIEDLYLKNLSDMRYLQLMNSQLDQVASQSQELRHSVIDLRQKLQSEDLTADVTSPQNSMSFSQQDPLPEQSIVLDSQPSSAASSRPGKRTDDTTEIWTTTLRQDDRNKTSRKSLESVSSRTSVKAEEKTTVRPLKPANHKGSVSRTTSVRTAKSART